MKKLVKAGLCGVAAAMLFTAGCSDKAAETKATESAAETAVEEASKAEAEETVAPEEEFDEEYVAESSVTLGEYKGLPVTVAKVEVTDEEVDAQVQFFLNACGEYVAVDRAAELGDVVNIDYRGLKDGEAFDGGTAEGSDLTLGSGQFIDGFEDGLVGAKKGEQRSLNLTFPEEYHSEELAGQDVVFEVTVNEVKQLEIPELDDAFVTKNFPEYANVAEFDEALRETLREQEQALSDNQRDTDLIQAILADSEVVCSTEEINEAYNLQLNSHIMQAAAYGADLENYASMFGMTEAEFKAQVRDAAREMAKQEVVLKEIARAENLTVDDADKEELAKSYGYESAEEMLKNVNITQEMVDDTALMRKALDFVIENAEITEE